MANLQRQCLTRRKMVLSLREEQVRRWTLQVQVRCSHLMTGQVHRLFVVYRLVDHRTGHSPAQESVTRRGRLGTPSSSIVPSISIVYVPFLQWHRRNERDECQRSQG